MTLDEFYRWLAFSSLEPFGDDRADWRSAMEQAQQANMNRKKGKSAYKVKDFLLRFRRGKREQTMEEMEAAMMAQFVAMGGKLPPEA